MLPAIFPIFLAGSLATGSFALGLEGFRAAGNAGVMHENQLYARAGPNVVPAVSILWNLLGCYTEISGGAVRAWTVPMQPGFFNVENCALACGNYTYMAVKSVGCSCGDSIHDGSVLISSTDPAVNGCNTPCTGNTTEYCGGASVLHIYQKQYPLRPSSTKAPVVATAVWTGTPTPGASIGSWKYSGCASDATTDHAPGADTPYYYRDTTRMTVESCLTYCSNRRLPLAGLQNGELCYCGGTLAATSAFGASCSRTCTGDSREQCGASAALSIYNLTSMPAPYHGQSPVVDGVTYKNQGCYKNNNPNALNGPHKTFSSQNGQSLSGMTVQTCIAWCRGQGTQYKYAGVMNFNACWCDSGVQANAVRQTTDWYCQTQCSGNLAQYCGGYGYMQIYYSSS